MAAIGYIRVSTEEQAVWGTGLPAQRERIRSYCNMVGLDLTEIVEECGVSGSVPLASRPQGRRLPDLLRGHPHIVVLRLDRLFRDAEDALRHTRAWDKAGITLHLIDLGGQALNTASAIGRLFLTLTAGFAEWERNLISERTSLALQYRRRRSQAYGPTPYGFNRRGHTLIPNHEEQAVLESIRRQRRSGWSLRRIADDLRARGIPTKRGGQWYASTVAGLVRDVPV